MDERTGQTLPHDLQLLGGDFRSAEVEGGRKQTMRNGGYKKWLLGPINYSRFGDARSQSYVERHGPWARRHHPLRKYPILADEGSARDYGLLQRKIPRRVRGNVLLAHCTVGC